MTDQRTEIISLRVSTSEKQRLAGAAERQGKSLSDWIRDELIARADLPYVFPGQNISVSLQPAGAGREDVIRSLRLALAAAERVCR